MLRWRLEGIVAGAGAVSPRDRRVSANSLRCRGAVLTHRFHTLRSEVECCEALMTCHSTGYPTRSSALRCVLRDSKGTEQLVKLAFSSRKICRWNDAGTSLESCLGYADKSRLDQSHIDLRIVGVGYHLLVDDVSVGRSGTPLRSRCCSNSVSHPRMTYAKGREAVSGSPAPQNIDGRWFLGSCHHQPGLQVFQLQTNYRFQDGGTRL
jgi:hypothetical protein